MALCSGDPPPKDFNLGLGVFIPKVLDNTPENTRPIAMTNTDNRLLAKTVASYILPSLAETLSVNQSAIIPGRDITDNIQAVTSAFYASLSKRSQMAILLTDFTKAFDSLHHSFLLKVLKKMEFPSFFVTLVQSLLSDVGIIPTCCPGREVVIPVGQGVKQGCPLSPALFIIAIDPLLFFLEKAGITSKWYFDDVAVLSDRPNDIGRALKLFRDFGDVSGLSLNPRKTVLLTALRPSHWFEGWREEIRDMLPGAYPRQSPTGRESHIPGCPPRAEGHRRGNLRENTREGKGKAAPLPPIPGTTLGAKACCGRQRVCAPHVRLPR